MLSGSLILLWAICRMTDFFNLRDKNRLLLHAIGRTCFVALFGGLRTVHSSSCTTTDTFMYYTVAHRNSCHNPGGRCSAAPRIYNVLKSSSSYGEKSVFVMAVYGK